MNIIDIVTLTILAFALYSGAREGLIIQTLSFIGIAIGVYFGAKQGEYVASIFGISGDYSSVWGFVIVLFITIIAMGIAARLIRGVLKFAGFGFLDIILGAIMSSCKYLLVLSFVFSAFDSVNLSYTIVEHKDIERSKLYRPIANFSKIITPAWDWTQEQFEQSQKEFNK
ncbi:MAG: CvpA family protein [Rikenellaceae bacterium]